MTTPVLTSAKRPDGTMSFIMPADQPAGRTPDPRDPALRRETQSSGRFAAVRYSGGWSEERSRRVDAELRTWMATRKLVAADDAQVAFYDPPFTPTFLRRNEVLIRVR